MRTTQTHRIPVSYTHLDVYKRQRMSLLRMTALDLAGKRVLIRQDLNVPVSDGRVTSDQRIVASLPTLQRALDQGAAVMVMSHLGRPKEGVWSEADSLAPVAARLGDCLLYTSRCV